MIVYIKPHSDIPAAFKHMKPIQVVFDSVDDRINENTFKCTAMYNLGEIQSIYATAFRTNNWTAVDISFAEDMRIVTRGRFHPIAMDPKEYTCMGEIQFCDMANAIETEKLTRDHNSLQHVNCLCTTAIAPSRIVRYTEYNIAMVDKGSRDLRAISELKVNKILSNGPATIVFWNDGTKTVVKREIDDEDDLYDAVANALAKKIFGSTSKFHRIINKKYCTNEKGWFD